MASNKMGKKCSSYEEPSKYGYWKYKDGSSYWGISLFRGIELPVEITKKEHKGDKGEKEVV